MPEAILLNKTFDFIMPLQKGYDADDGYYHIKFAISSANPDFQQDQMTEKCLNEMVLQAKGLNVDGSRLKGINIDDNHLKGLNALIGPVTDAWLDTEKVLWVDLKVRKEWETTIKDLVDSGTHLGGSIQGKAMEILPADGSGIRKINGVLLVKAALTDTPAAWDTRGTAQAVSKACFGSMCTQIMKSYESMLKDINLEPNNGGDNLKDKIPEGMDESFVEKLKTVGDDGKQFIKGLFGFEDPEDPNADANNKPDPTPGGEPMEKDMISKDDVTKMLDERDSKFEKTLKEKDEKIESLEKRLNSSDEVTEEKTKKDLLTKSLDLHKKLKKDMTPEEESDLVKEIKADLDKDHGLELVKRDITSMTKALDQVPAHDPPHLNDEIKKQQADEKADLLKTLDKRGRK